MFALKHKNRDLSCNYSHTLWRKNTEEKEFAFVVSYKIHPNSRNSDKNDVTGIILMFKWKVIMKNTSRVFIPLFVSIYNKCLPWNVHNCSASAVKSCKKCGTNYFQSVAFSGKKVSQKTIKEIKLQWNTCGFCNLKSLGCWQDERNLMRETSSSLIKILCQIVWLLG